MVLSGQVTGTVTVTTTVYEVAAWLLLMNLKLYPPEIQSPGLMWRSPSMLEGPMLKLLLPVVVVPQPSVAVAEPLMVMENVDPELVRTAEPVTVQFVDKFPEGSQVFDADTVAVLSVELPSLVVVKTMLPGTTVIEPPQFSVKLKSISYCVFASRSVAFTVRL